MNSDITMILHIVRQRGRHPSHEENVQTEPEKSSSDDVEEREVEHLEEEQASGSIIWSN